jgi:hypothetical protein
MELHDLGTSPLRRRGHFVVVGRNGIPSHGEDGARPRVTHGRLGRGAGVRRRSHQRPCVSPGGRGSGRAGKGQCGSAGASPSQNLGHRTRDGEALSGLCLAPLGNYDGPTETMALLPGSAAIGAGIALSGVTTDQRGELLDSPAPDIGAYQTQGFTITPVTGSTPQAVAAGDAFADPLAVTVTANAPNQPVAGGTVTYTANPASNGASANLSNATASIGDDGALLLRVC